ncbi:uncharacterized protein KIAA1671 homolog isoform X1 [Python bivittatus]|uniref:Uncharacterized protein KIAA1671 homolog isoform X1 n=1 Tax=Python bivittatus TaxID=176946 RepID=A0A9F5IWH5_PYTBI|nr:uncharacterized protein KIAA1671 homolog isoform X1 [Python bivittatus]XP_025024910.1 uncharacterized protein KIAA1671 homolog isoform X1 [Python bivittatus]XP_025024911.1 uncharacterized protein KIAA1671 homolog isoform X1 [Python bivittatus]XP_025024912.1 uncharacterized protein KIAA1671 homolog isoform X1 [Python bivittatus]XP_025024913.1 uncharacterized protein KIAA1671 homolog isoform X1 [Python bivittatus]XP_025024914.1 uncharacterized protein KIAA1671 homolog isoform X1 [Python bivit
MATQVEVGSVLTSLASRSEPRNEAMLQHSFISSLSDPSRKPREDPSSLAPLILEGGNKLGNPVRPATVPSAASRPRLTPKPFSRETSSDAFAAVKPPVPGLKPGSVTPESPTFAQTFEDAAERFTGNVPPLLDQKLIGSKSPRELIATVPFYLSPQANTVILLESRSPEKEKAEDEGGPRKAREGQLLSSPSERWSRRQPSLSTDPSLVSWSPHRSLERKEIFSGAPKGLASSVEPQQHPSLAPETHSQAQGRLASLAVFLESCQEQTQPTPPEAASGLWVQKPRPLSADLTGKFENRELSFQKKSCLAESREKSFAAAKGRPLETMAAKSEAAGFSVAEPCSPRVKSASQLAESPSAKSQGSTQSCLPSAGGVAPPGQAVPEDSGQIFAKDRKDLWELESPGKPSVGQYNASKGQALREKVELPPKEAGLRNANPPDTLDLKNRGCVKKTLPLLDASANNWIPTETESFFNSPGKENRILNIQQRIKELTAENTDFKPENLRRSFRSRPLSTDLTKVFSGPVTASDMKPRRQPEWTRKPVSEIQDAQGDETLPAGGTDFREACTVGSPWKPPLLAKAPSTEGPPEGEGGFTKGRQNVSLPGERPGLVLSPKAKMFSSSPTEEACLKTVRATMFEHHVQRHSVVANQLGAEPSLLPLMESSGELFCHCQELWKERVLGVRQSTKGSTRETDLSGDAGKPKDPRPLTEDKGSLALVWAENPVKEKREKPASKRMEDSLLYQRIEPRYEILQTLGEKVQSEAVAAVPEGKAVTLRRERSLKESRRASRGAEDESDGWRGGPHPKGPALGTSPLKDLPASWSQRTVHREGTGLGRNQAGQQLASEKAISFTSRTKDDGIFAPCLETEREKTLAPAGALEGSKMLDCFPERAGTGVREADGCENRAGVLGQKSTPSLAAGRKNQASPPGTSQWQRVSCTGLLSSLDLKPPSEPEELKGQKMCSARGGAQEKLGGVTEGNQLQPLDLEARWKSSFRNVSAPKVSDRWRRKTVPHSAARFEDVREPSQGTTELASRRDALHLLDCSIAKRSPQTPHRIDLRQAEVTSPSSLKKQLSPSEPKAMYFAVTCQISEEINNKPGKDASVAPHVSSSRRADPSNQQHRECFPESPSSPDRPLSKHRGERAALDLPEKGASEHPLAEARERGRELLHRQPEEAEGHPAGADPPPCPAARSPSYLASLRQEKATDCYRSRVVDIDELMAEYGGDSQKVSGMEDQKESTLFPWEKLPSRRNFTGSISCSSDQREVTRVERSPGSRRPGTDASSCENGRTHGSDPLEICTQESSPLRARDGKHSPPHWGRPDIEETKRWSAEPVGPRTKTSFFVGKEQGEGIRRGPQSAEDATLQPVRMDLGALWKEASPRQWAVLAPAGGWCPSGDSGGKTGRKADTHAGVWETDSPAAQTGTERSSATCRGTDAWPDPKCSSSGKARQAQARPGLPLGARLDEHRICRSFPPERPGARVNKGAPSPRDCFSHEGDRGLEKESLKEDHDGAGTRHSPYLLMQRRSHSFYKERRTDHWSGDHLKQCFGRPAAEARDTDVLVQEADSRYGTWGNQRHSGDSFVPESPSSESSAAPTQKPSPSSRASVFSSPTDPASKEQRSTSLDDFSPDAESADGASASPPTEFSFLDQTPRLDSRLLKSRVLLGKRRQQRRAPISHTLRRSAGGDAEQPPTLFSGTDDADSAWMFRDSTEVKPTKGGESEEEGKSPSAERPPPSQPRLPLFPGLDPSALKAQLRKRHESEGREEATPAPLCKSPKGPFQAGVSGGRALTAAPRKEERSEELPPRWLKELKSKKKQSQPESPI